MLIPSTHVLTKNNLRGGRQIPVHTLVPFHWEGWRYKLAQRGFTGLALSPNLSATDYLGDYADDSIIMGERTVGPKSHRDLLPARAKRKVRMGEYYIKNFYIPPGEFDIRRGMGARLKRLTEDLQNLEKFTLEGEVSTANAKESDLDLVLLKWEDLIIGAYNVRHNRILCRAWPSVLDTIIEEYPEKISPPDAAKEIKDRAKQIAESTIKVGSDPELELWKKETLRDARSELIEVYGHQNFMSRGIGTDGCSNTMEFRPRPGTYIQHVKNLEGLIRKIKADAPEFSLRVKGDSRPLGCHIHIGGIFDIESRLVEIFDYYVGRVAKRKNGAARGGYGRLSDWREQPWGIEYRTPPAAIIYRPDFFYVFCKTMYLIALKWNQGESFELDDAIFKDTSKIPPVGDYIKLGLTEEDINILEEFKKVEIKNEDISQNWLGGEFKSYRGV